MWVESERDHFQIVVLEHILTIYVDRLERISKGTHLHCNFVGVVLHHFAQLLALHRKHVLWETKA